MRSFHLQRWVKINIDNREGQIRVVLCYSVPGFELRMKRHLLGPAFTITRGRPEPSRRAVYAQRRGNPETTVCCYERGESGSNAR
jgi:hypothetical protein